MLINLNNISAESELKKRITAELREKQSGKSLVDDDLTAPEYDIDTGTYLQKTKTTTSLAWAWALLALAAVGTIIAIMVVIT